MAASEISGSTWTPAAASAEKSVSISPTFSTNACVSGARRCAGHLPLHPVDAPRGPDQGRTEADEGGEGGGRERGPADRRRPTLLPPLRADGGDIIPGSSTGSWRHCAGPKSRRPNSRRGKPSCFRGRRSTGRPRIAMEADPHRRQSHAASSRGQRQESEQGRSLWPSLRSQIFRIDAVTHGGQRVEIGETNTPAST